MESRARNRRRCRWNGFRAGGFGSVNFFSSSGGGVATIGSSELGTAGLEAEADIGNVTVGAQGAYNGFFDCSGVCPEVWEARAWADLYIGGNTRLGIEGGYWNVGNVPMLPNKDIWSVAGTAEHRFAGSPISFFARGEYEHAFNDAFNTVIVSGGLRVLIDDGLTLEEHDRQVPFNVRFPRFVETAYAGGFLFNSGGEKPDE